MNAQCSLALIANISINRNDNDFLRMQGGSDEVVLGDDAFLLEKEGTSDVLFRLLSKESMLLNGKCLVIGALIGYRPQQVFLLAKYIYKSCALIKL